jgi:hypothetical protein
MPKASAEKRRQCIAEMIEAARPWLHLEPILVAGDDDDPQLDQRRREEWETLSLQLDQRRREEWETLSDSMLEAKRLWLSARLGEEIGTSLFEREQKFSQDGGKARAQQRRQMKLKKIEEGGRLLAEHPKQPKLSAKRAYDLLGLHDGIIKSSSFERRWWREIRKYDRR